jgi:putative ABC transport system permease protein
LAIALVIIGTFCLFTSGSIALLKILRKNKKFYYRASHFISVSGMIYRMKQNAAGLATICILSCMVLVTVSSTVSLNLGVEDSLNHQFPYDYQMDAGTPEDADLLWNAAVEAAGESGAEIAGLQRYTPYGFMAVENNGAFTDAIVSGVGVYFEIIALDEYNRNEGTSEALADGEALVLTTGGHYTRETLTVNGHTFRVRPLDKRGKTVNGSGDIMQTFTLVVKNAAVAETLAGAQDTATGKPRTQIAFDITGDKETHDRFYFAVNRLISRVKPQEAFHFRIREDNREEWYATNGGFLFLGIYFGILFMLAAALIIYYKQISEGYDDAERFQILQKVGMGEAEVKKTINRQIMAVFFLPLLAAVVHVTVAFFPISRVMIIFGVFNIPLQAAASAVTVLVYAAVYFIVFRQTARTYYRIVKF